MEQVQRLLAPQRVASQVMLDSAERMGLKFPFRHAALPPDSILARMEFDFPPPKDLTMPRNRETFSAPGYAFPVIHAMLAGGVRSHLIGREPETLKQPFKHFIDTHVTPWHRIQVGVAPDRSLTREIRRAGGYPPLAPSSPKRGSYEVKGKTPLNTNYQEKARCCVGGEVRAISHFETPARKESMEIERL